MLLFDPSIKQLQSKNNISYSVLNRINRWSWEEIYLSKSRDLIELCIKKRESHVKIIKNYIVNTRTTITAKQITDHVNRTLQTSYSLKYKRKFMKTQAKLKFKRVKSKICNFDLEKLSSIKHLKAGIFTKQMIMDTLLVDINEWSINRNTKLKNSWGI